MDRNILLIVDDVELNRMLLRNVFEEEYNILEAENGEQALFLIKQYQDSIAAILLDIVMPVKDGYEVLENMKQAQLTDKLPVIVVTSRDSSDDEVLAFDLGAVDIVSKPFEPHVVSRRVHNAVELSQNREHLEQTVEEQAASLQRSTNLLVDALSSVIEHRSVESGQHVLRIRTFTKVLLENVMQSYPEYGLNEQEIAMISSAAALHDVGKIAIPDIILNKPGKLTEEEFEIMKIHAEKGGEILSVLNPIHDKKYLQYAYNICMYHHKRWDGKGYPEGLKGENIPICAQAVGVADVYDALTTQRVYKGAYTPETAFSMILNGECGQFSPKLLESFKNVFPTFMKLTYQYADGISLKATFAKEDLAEKKTVVNPTTLELGQLKYFAMLRYEGATVIEADVDTGVYHITYKQNSDFDMLSTDGSFFDVYNEFILHCTHPDDQVGFDAKTYFYDFIASGSLAKTRRYRILRGASGNFVWYKATALRLTADNPAIHKILIIWKIAPTELCDTPERNIARLPNEANALIAAMQCAYDQYGTILNINDGFMALLGYSRAELTSHIQNHYIELVCAEDRATLLKNVHRQLCRKNVFETEYRVQTKDGRILWVLDKSQLLAKPDGTEYINTILTDITKTKQEQEELRLSMERHRIIMEQSNDIIFEWDIRKNKVLYSANWEKKYGYTPISEEIDLRIANSSHIHPKDIPAFLSLMHSVSSGAPYGEAELRIANADGQYIWNRLRATTQFDQSGKPVKAVGVILDIGTEKQRVQDLIDKSERDPLTHLFNREATERRIQHIFEKAESDCKSAMMIIDLDNFKMVNDTFGHLFGNVVLAEVAAQMRLIFRPGDILSRIGGDEFLVYMNDISSKNGPCNRAEQLIEGIRGVLREKLGSFVLSCSIGLAYFPEDAREFQNLFHCCDQALYHAKAQGKNRYALYDKAIMEQWGDFPGQPLMIATTRIESNETYEQDTVETIQQVFRVLYGETDMGQAIQSVLSLLGQKYQVNRAYLVESVEKGRHNKAVYEWCAEGTVPLKEKFPHLPYYDVQATNHLLDASGIFNCPDVDMLPERELKLLRTRSAEAVLGCAFFDGTEFTGFIGFDSAGKRRWTQGQISVLSFLSEWLSAFLIKKRAQDSLADFNQNLCSLLDAQSSWIYVVDPDTYTLKYINAQAQRLLPGAKVGMCCYETLFGRSTPCGRCPMKEKLACPEGAEQMELYNSMLKIWNLAEAFNIKWDGADACMITCQDITRYKA